MRQKSQSSGIFLTLEGGEGVGKTTQIAALSHYLTSCGIDHVTTQEPGGTVQGTHIRGHLKTLAWSSLSELLLMYAARIEHIDRLIKPSLAKGLWVLCDRYIDSSVAYQVGGGRLPMSHIHTLNQWVQPPMPNITFLLDHSRVMNKDQAEDILEDRSAVFWQRVHYAYHCLAQREPTRVVMIDAHQDEGAVTASIIRALQERKLLS